MVIFAIIIALLVGIGTPVQTAINSRLRGYVQSPFLASLISFLVGIVLLLFLTLASKHTIFIPREVFLNEPWWLWFGGLFAATGLTANILLFPKLGGVQTVIMPMFGQIIMGMLIDNFGWFHSPQIPFTFWRMIGIFLVLGGIFMVIMLSSLLQKKTEADRQPIRYKWIWQTAGIIAGMMIATQVAINGRLGVVLHSPVHATFVSFMIGIILLLTVISLLRHPLKNIAGAIKMKTPWWVWTGGIFGSLFVMGYVFLVPILGTGPIVIFSLFGQICGSIVIDRYGWVGAPKRPVTPIQKAGLVTMLAGVIIIRIF